MYLTTTLLGFMFFVLVGYLQGLRRNDPLANGDALELGDAVPVICSFFLLPVYTLQLFDRMPK